MTPLKRAKLWLLGPRDYPEAVITLPEHLVRDFPELLARARDLNPAVSVNCVAQAVWRLGCYRLGQNLLRRIPVKVADVPAPAQKHPRHVETGEHSGRRRCVPADCSGAAKREESLGPPTGEFTQCNRDAAGKRGFR